MGKWLEKALTPTGILGLDQLVRGGFPAGRSVLVGGPPGSGKTIFCAQFLYNGASKYGENGVFVTLDQKPDNIIQDAAGLGMNLRELSTAGRLKFVDASPVRGGVIVGVERRYSLPSFTGEGLVDEIGRVIRSIGGKRVALDSLTGLLLQYRDIFKRRLETMRIIEGIARLGCTLVMTTESANPKSFEMYAADGAILFSMLPMEQGAVKAMQVLKLRGVKHDYDLHPYEISNRGIEIYPEEKVFYQAGRPP